MCPLMIIVMEKARDYGGYTRCYAYKSLQEQMSSEIMSESPLYFINYNSQPCFHNVNGAPHATRICGAIRGREPPRPYTSRGGCRQDPRLQDD